MQSKNTKTTSISRREWFSRAATTAVAASFGYPILANAVPSIDDSTASISDPPNVATQHIWDTSKGVLRLAYNGAVIFEATVSIKDVAGIRPPRPNEVVLRGDATQGDKVEQRFRFELQKATTGTELVLRGTVNASDEAFPAETLSEAQKRFPIIRNSVGLSDNLRNNAVYDRRWDWVLTGSADEFTRIKPEKATNDGLAFSWESHGSAIELVFRPLFYQKHKNLRYFKPWTYPIRKDSISGWCSWWAYRGGCTEDDVTKIAKVMEEKNLRDFGYRWIQLDDSYQRAEPGRSDDGTPEKWLTWNSKFPGGIETFLRTVRNAGFNPGMWMQVYFKDDKTAQEHPNWFVRNADDQPWKARWVSYGIDATNPDAANTLIRPIFRAYREKGFSYVKIDTLRHLLYDSLNNAGPAYLNFLRTRGLTIDDVYRRYLAVAREELGRDTFVLGCWGVLPESIGYVDGCRLGGDGFGPATLQQYNSWNGVVWRNDPDHCDLRPTVQGVDEGNVTRTMNVESIPADAIIRPTLVSMAGAMLMLSDKAEIYSNDANLEGAKRAAPILFTVPGQLYDYDPSRSNNVITIDRSQISGGTASSTIDATSNGKVCPWWMLEINQTFERWTVLARMNWENAQMGEQTVRFADLGLPADNEYLIYEFWTKKYLGVQKEQFISPSLESKGTQVYAIRKKLDCPQIISTNRHISQGGVDLQNVTWDANANTLSGRSQVVRDDAYDLVVRVPDNFQFAGAPFDHVLSEITPDGALHLRFYPNRTGEMNWTFLFRKIQ